MSLRRSSLLSVAAAVLLSACAQQPQAPAPKPLYVMESGVIESREGFVDSVSGARVESVEPHGNGESRVLVSLPADGDTPAREIEEVLVTAPRVEPDAPVVKPRYEFVKDYANDRYGFYIYLGNQKSLPFRLYFKDVHAGSVQESRP